MYRVETPCLVINFAGTRNAVMVESRMEARLVGARRPSELFGVRKSKSEHGTHGIDTPNPASASRPSAFWLLAVSQE